MIEWENHEKFGLQKITVEEIKKIDGFQQISDGDALKIIDELCRLTIITYNIYKKNDGTRAI